ncbi:MAG: hypothetical protein N4A41_01310 [Crocinitomicaceae bacterium]|jgi:hypothetical protein|nr:hypothetical protein [Crocinitomicaceae bacterium]
MTKKRAIISYDKLSIVQKKGILKEYPDGYVNHLTQIKTPLGEVLEALIWETEETIYLVKFPKVQRALVSDDDDDDDMDDDISDDVDVNDDDMDSDDDEDDSYDDKDDSDDEDED